MAYVAWRRGEGSVWGRGEVRGEGRSERRV